MGARIIQPQRVTRSDPDRRSVARSRTDSTAGAKRMPMRKMIAVVFLASAAVGAASAWAFNTSFLRDAPLAYFTDKDWSLFKDALDRALNGGADGATARWDNPSSGSSGEVTPLDTRQVNGMTCRNTRIINSAQGLTARGDYQLCKAADGEWTLGGPTN